MGGYKAIGNATGAAPSCIPTGRHAVTHADARRPIARRGRGELERGSGSRKGFGPASRERRRRHPASTRGTSRRAGSTRCLHFVQAPPGADGIRRPSRRRPVGPREDRLGRSPLHRGRSPVAGQDRARHRAGQSVHLRSEPGLGHLGRLPEGARDCLEAHKRIVPVLFEDLGDVEQPVELGDTNWIDFRREDDHDVAVAKVLDALDSDLEWRDAHTQLGLRAAEWAGSARDASFLLRGSELGAAEAWSD